MYIEDVEYTAELIKSVAVLAGKTIGDTTRQVGVEGVERLIHNAPMNKLLQYERIVKEILHDYGFYLSAEANREQILPDRGYGHYIAALVAASTQDHHEYANVLYGLLTDGR